MADLYWTKTSSSTMYARYSITLKNSGGTLYDPTTTWQQKLGESSDRMLSIKFTCEQGLVLPANCRYLFAYANSDWSTKSNIKNFTSVDTSEVENMTYMFYYSDLRFVDFSNFNTSNVTNMSHMFEHAHHILNVDNGYDVPTDLTSFDTSKVATMNSMFYHSNLESPLWIEGWDVSNVDDFQLMFGPSTFGTSTEGYRHTNIEHNGIYVGENIDWSRQVKPTANTTNMFSHTSAYNGKFSKSAEEPYDIRWANTGSHGVFWGDKAEFWDKYNLYFYDSEFTSYSVLEKTNGTWEDVDVYKKTSS